MGDRAPALLIVRPQPGADATAAAARGRGMQPVVAPLFTVVPVGAGAPPPPHDAILMTSANAARFADDGLRHRPVHAVGAQTAAAARAASFVVASVGDGDADDALEQAVATGATTILHLCGRDRRSPVAPPGVTIVPHIVYASIAVTPPPLPSSGIALVHSPRAAARLATCVDPVAFALVAISARAAAAAGPGWRRTRIAASPDDAAMLALASELCKEMGNE